jgi:sortase A
MTLRIKPPKPFPSRFGRFLRWGAPLLLLFVGVCALGYSGYVLLDARFSQDHQSQQFDLAVRDANAPAPTDTGTTRKFIPGDIETKDAVPTPTSANAGEKLPLGRIEIDSIGLTAMIQEGTGSQTLQRGVGHITGTALLGHSGNIGLAGHRDTFFRKLRGIHEGDEIKLTTLTGSFLYRVDLISIVEPQDSQVLRGSGQDILTLVTCYPFSFVGPAPKRFIVRARQVERAPAQLSAAQAPPRP